MAAAAVNQALGSSPTFILEVMERLHYPKAVVGKTLLSMLRKIHQHHTTPATLVRDFNLYQIVLKLSQNESQVLVAELAAQLLQDFDEHSGSVQIAVRAKDGVRQAAAGGGVRVLSSVGMSTIDDSGRDSTHGEVVTE